MLNKDQLLITCKESNWKTVSFTADDGTLFFLTPHSNKRRIHSENDVVWWQVESNEFPWLSDCHLDTILENIANLPILRKEREHELMLFSEFLVKQEEKGWTEETYQLYRDWHKDLYGDYPNE